MQKLCLALVLLSCLMCMACAQLWGGRRDNGWDNGNGRRDNGWDNGNGRRDNGWGWDNGNGRRDNGNDRRDNGWDNGNGRRDNGNGRRDNGWDNGYRFLPLFWKGGDGDS